ncbi:beta-1,3-galactosyltransferase 5-like isoform X2 [Schistocerca serialis cubense]|uniref:beta-1,3-galactosyltransferase 5-like isoform X2 n=1 Tax=Schistocerca serialis cubense TaxID=2023355 RepID=UPI00214F356C|nr:beta-1,3-galactosyltransferase 5-like isoform X2 [Schistocerca serialis cubense]
MIRLQLLIFTLCLLAICVIGLIGLFTIIAENEQPFLIRPRPRQFYDLYPLDLQLLNLPHFSYIINNDICGQKTVESVLLVTSHCGNVEARSAIRQAYPQHELIKLGIRRLFLLAVSLSVNQNSIHDENRRYADVLQGSFLEAYRNLTYKHVMGLQWAVHHCPQARFVIKMDDDIVVNMYKLSEIISYISESQRKDLLMGYVLKGMVPVREPANKWPPNHEKGKRKCSIKSK